MGITLDLKHANARLEVALEIALSDAPVPALWLERADVIAASPSKTFTPAFATGLLARATNADVDVLALKATSGDRAYSARSLSDKVLVPAAKRHRIDIRTTGREPLNNQPFFRYDRIDAAERVKRNARESFAKLIEYLREVDKMTSDEALLALAAFLRSRISAAQLRPQIRLSHSDITAVDMIERCTHYVSERSESGKRAQALVAAVFDLAFDDVRCERVNDPSRKEAGDVRVYSEGQLVLAVEVRDKAVTQSDAMAFAASLEAKGATTGAIVALDESHHLELDRRLVMLEAERDYGVALTVVEGLRELISGAITWSGSPIDQLLATLPTHVLIRLEEIEVEDASLIRWAELTAALP